MTLRDWYASGHPDWKRGPRVRVESLRKGTVFLAMAGQKYCLDRKDGALSGVYHVTDIATGKRTAMAGCAEVLVLVRSNE